MNRNREGYSKWRHSAGVVVMTLASMSPFARAHAQTQAPVPLLVDTQWLSQHLEDADLVILEVGAKADYQAGHIPGARVISEEDVSTPHDMSKMATELMLELPPIAELRTRVAAFGISDNTRIVVYAGKSSAIQSATRIVFTLDYLGLGARTSLLNGGFASWTRAKLATVTDAPAVTAGKLTARPANNIVADSEYVKSISRRSDHRLIDARGAVFYQGIQAPMGPAGHIPGAISIPFSEITDNEQLIDRERVAALFQAAGVKPGDTIVAYCHVGQQATAVVFAARLLGHRALLYDGSFQDWAINVHGPVER